MGKTVCLPQCQTQPEWGAQTLGNHNYIWTEGLKAMCFVWLSQVTMSCFICLPIKVVYYLHGKSRRLCIHLVMNGLRWNFTSSFSNDLKIFNGRWVTTCAMLRHWKWPLHYGRSQELTKINGRHYGRGCWMFICWPTSCPQHSSFIIVREMFRLATLIMINN